MCTHTHFKCSRGGRECGRTLCKRHGRGSCCAPVCAQCAWATPVGQLPPAALTCTRPARGRCRPRPRCPGRCCARTRAPAGCWPPPAGTPGPVGSKGDHAGVNQGCERVEGHQALLQNRPSSDSSCAQICAQPHQAPTPRITPWLAAWPQPAHTGVSKACTQANPHPILAPWPAAWRGTPGMRSRGAARPARRRRGRRCWRSTS